MTETPALTPARLWKQMTPDQRTRAAHAFWSDPDATDDAKAGGQFWVVLKARDSAAPIPDRTRVIVTIRPLDRSGGELTATAAPVDGLISRQFAALRMDHEGPFAVRVAIDGPLGRAEVASQVDATYDLRPEMSAIEVTDRDPLTVSQVTDSGFRWDGRKPGSAEIPKQLIAPLCRGPRRIREHVIPLWEVKVWPIVLIEIDHTDTTSHRFD